MFSVFLLLSGLTLDDAAATPPASALPLYQALFSMTRQSSAVSLSYEDPWVRCAESAPSDAMQPLVAPSDTTPQAAIVQLVDQWNARGAQTTFAVEDVDGMLHVKPATTLDGACATVPATPLLDAKVSIHADQRTRDAIVRDIAEQMGDAAGVRVGIGTAPLNLLLQTRATLHLDEVPARQALKALLADDQVTWAWYLFRSPSSDGFVLNLAATRDPRSRLWDPDKYIKQAIEDGWPVEDLLTNP